MKTLLFVLGTRPETIKLAPVIRAAKDHGFLPYLVHTGQHHSHNLGTAFLEELDLPQPDTHLGVGSTTPSEQTAAILTALQPILQDVAPAMVLVQGDTTSAMAGALAANQNGIPVAHVEAGLRSWDRRMPEEHNRVMIDQMAELLFAPTDVQLHNLRREGHSGRTHVVGNTVTDALRWGLNKAGDPDATLKEFGVAAGKFGFMTLHRAENVDDPAVLTGILGAAAEAGRAADIELLLPLHPRTQKSMETHGVTLPDGIRKLPPIGYRACLHLQQQAAVVVSDSGGLQEEASVLGVPCVTLRLSTERPETVHAGGNVIAGVEPKGIVAAVAQSLGRDRQWTHPYGDGNCAEAILQHVAQFLGSELPGQGQGSTVAHAAPDPAQLPQDGDCSGRWLGAQELTYLGEVVRSGTLNSTKGTMVTRFEKAFAQRFGAKHAIACGSGSAAVHCAVAAIKLKPGDEVITTPITDMGGLTPIVYEGGVPVFADVDPVTLNVTADTIKAQITDRTVAIIVTHLFGLSCDMGPILALAKEKGIKVIEDCAQAFLAEDKVGMVGRMGHIACFSMQQGKHMTTGEGGIVITDDDALARETLLFVNKAWGYGDPKPDHYFPALNYRLTELQGAVALAQLEKLDWVVDSRREVACMLHRALDGIDGVHLPTCGDGQRHVYWKYALRVDKKVIEGGAVGLGGALRTEGIFCAPRYVVKPAFECQLFQDWSASPITSMPMSNNPRQHGPQPPFQRADYPGSIAGLEQVLVLPINEFYTPANVAHVASKIREQAAALRHG